MLSLGIKSSYSVKVTFPAMFWSQLNKIDAGQYVKHITPSDDGGSTFLIAILSVGWLYFQARGERGIGALNPRNPAQAGISGPGHGRQKSPRHVRPALRARADMATVQTFATLPPNPHQMADFPNQGVQLHMLWLCVPQLVIIQCDTEVLGSLMTALKTEPRKCTPMTECQLLKLLRQPP